MSATAEEEWMVNESQTRARWNEKFNSYTYRGFDGLPLLRVYWFGDKPAWAVSSIPPRPEKTRDEIMGPHTD